MRAENGLLWRESWRSGSRLWDLRSSDAGLTGAGRHMRGSERTASRRGLLSYKGLKVLEDVGGILYGGVLAHIVVQREGKRGMVGTLIVIWKGGLPMVGVRCAVGERGGLVR